MAARPAVDRVLWGSLVSIAVAWFAIEHLAVRSGIGLLGLVGIAYIWWRVPTREVVLAERAAA